MASTRFASVADALAAEQQLLASGAAGLLVWQTSAHCLVIPAHLQRNPEYARAAACSAAAGWPVQSRASGGGIVPQGAGILNLSMVWPRPDGMALEGAYRTLCTPIQQSLQEIGLASTVGSVPGSFCDGRFNVVADGRKIAGTAQQWRARAGGMVVLAHAVILSDPPLDSMVVAVDAFQQALGLGAVQRAAHVSIAQALTQEHIGFDPAGFAERIAAAARRALAGLPHRATA